MTGVNNIEGSPCGQLCPPSTTRATLRSHKQLIWLPMTVSRHTPLMSALGALFTILTRFTLWPTSSSSMNRTCNRWKLQENVMPIDNYVSPYAADERTGRSVHNLITFTLCLHLLPPSSTRPTPENYKQTQWLPTVTSLPTSLTNAIGSRLCQHGPTENLLTKYSDATFVTLRCSGQHLTATLFLVP